jgi:aspartate ammonia-lyase
MGAFVTISSIQKRLAIKLSKICNDLRLLSSGPRAGLNEINLPAMQPGSSIMPGKINPVIPEAVNQTAFQVIGHDLTVTMAAEAGQLQLNAMEPVIVYNILNSMKMLSSAIYMLDHRCIRGITANKAHCHNQVKDSIGMITALVPYIGYDNASRIAKHALVSRSTVGELILKEKLLDEATLNHLMSPANMTGPMEAAL